MNNFAAFDYAGCHTLQPKCLDYYSNRFQYFLIEIVSKWILLHLTNDFEMPLDFKHSVWLKLEWKAVFLFFSCVCPEQIDPNKVNHDVKTYLVCLLCWHLLDFIDNKTIACQHMLYVSIFFWHGEA